MKTVEYFYSAHSAYAYLGAARLYEICRAQGARLIHRPFALSPVVEQQGSLPFRARTQAHVDYFFGRELIRWADLRGVPIIGRRPTHHDADYSLANGLIASVGHSGADVDALSLALLRAHWVDDIDLSNPSQLGDCVAALGLDPMRYIAMAASEDMQAQCRRNTEEAKCLNVFGSPTYIVDGDPFYGQDHLDMVERALVRPFERTPFRNPAVDG